MKAYRGIALIVAIILLALFALGGCGGKDQTDSTSARLACIELMQKVPILPVYCDVGLEFWDVKTLRSDPDLAETYQVFYERRADFLVELFEMDIDSIDYMANAHTVTLMKGDFDLDTIRENMPVGFTRTPDYEVPEVWERPPSHDWRDITGGVMFTEDLFIWGANSSDVGELLPVYENEELSVYDENAAEVLDRLPSALVVSFIRYSYPEGWVISATAFTKEETGAFRQINLYKFESPDYVASAEVAEYFQKIEDDVEEIEGVFAERGEPCPVRSFTIEQDGEFVEWSVIVEEEYMIAFFFYG
jgi:hypothetical protein